MMINFLGSSPSAHIKCKYDLLGLPLHLTRYTNGVPRATLKPAGEREIDRRLSVNIKTTPVKSTTAKKQLKPAKEKANPTKKTPPRKNTI